MSEFYRVHGDVAVLTLDNPPVNGLGHALRTALVEGIDRANADAAVKAIVITGAGNAFSGGADIKEFNTPKALAEPTLRTVINTAESSAKPVISAINGLIFSASLRTGTTMETAIAGSEDSKSGLLVRVGRHPEVPAALRSLLMGPEGRGQPF